MSCPELSMNSIELVGCNFSTHRGEVGRILTPKIVGRWEFFYPSWEGGKNSRLRKLLWNAMPFGCRIRSINIFFFLICPKYDHKTSARCSICNKFGADRSCGFFSIRKIAQNIRMYHPGHRMFKSF